jgi:signal transduction histidine kinase
MLRPNDLNTGETVRMETEKALEMRQGSGRGILIVDDEDVIRELCAKALRGYRILQAADGAEALSILEKETVDVVLTDIMMPQMNGLDLLKAVKEREPTQVVVVMTGYADKEIILRALKADADDFISKPINLLQLKTTIDKALEKKALKEELVQLKRMDRLKSDFLGLISHKLKTPTTAISLFIQNLEQGIGDPTDPAFQKTLSLIIEESQYLNYLIQDLLYYSEIILQEGPPRLGSVNPGELAAAVVKELQKYCHNKGLMLVSSLNGSLPEMNLDRQRIAFALRSLLENAIKFTPPGGTISLDAQVRDDSVRLVVQDSGPGIPREELPKVFEKFYQVDPARTGQVRGFGLGLYYARQFAQSHGGNILLECPPGGGTVATLILPR